MLLPHAAVLLRLPSVALSAQARTALHALPARAALRLPGRGKTRTVRTPVLRLLSAAAAARHNLPRASLPSVALRVLPAEMTKAPERQNSGALALLRFYQTVLSISVSLDHEYIFLISSPTFSSWWLASLARFA